MLRAALIDVGGTLWPESGPWRDRQRRRLQALLGLPPQEASRLADALDDEVASWESPATLEQDTVALIDEVLRQLGLTRIQPPAVQAAMCVPASDGSALFAGAPELLETIGDLGLRSVLVSNTAWRDADAYKRDFEYFGVSEHVHAIITSLDVGFRKPHRAIIGAALDAAECGAPECVVLGDSEQKDIAAAVAHGMRSILVAIEQPPPARTAADAVATSLEQARQIVTSWVTP